MIQGMASIWRFVYSIEVMWYQKMLMLLLQQSKRNEVFNLLTGARLVLKLASIINHQLLFQAVILLRFFFLLDHIKLNKAFIIRDQFPEIYFKIFY